MKKTILAALCLLTSQTVMANGGMYGLFSAGYADASQGQAGDKGIGYSFAMGYELDKQWFVEGGFQQLIDEDGDAPVLSNLGSEDNSSLKADALYLALLGKASSQAGTLFYRVGVMSVKLESQAFIGSGQSCEEGEGSAYSLEGGDAVRCSYDETIVAGVVGLGFDFKVADAWDVRIEAQHVRGKDGFEANIGQIGLRYNF
ncbi:outer membrane beta-barrel protein [Bowmanella sp. Y26]|uniref:outer membrane beta-barrel protein n=1 Tax=Bowmanella yangjiangensis TaxID=2811230 RepID=UPI001BDCC571|nr:outer membrane beta-barrel protein [Bowmanella yangjiangensis]MBT1064810.1 outer membrane beta-barrel protein [Bowmanella yangjiangensis]